MNRTSESDNTSANNKQYTNQRSSSREGYRSMSLDESSGEYGNQRDRHNQARVAGELLYQSVSTSTTPRSHLNSIAGSSSYPPIGLPAPAWVSENQRACCGLMSPVRRTFCLFVTFDFIFTFLLWVIYTQVLGIGHGIKEAFWIEVVKYTFQDSLFDTVMCSTVRMVPLLLAYALYRSNRPWIVAVTTSITCIYMLVKVAMFDFKGTANLSHKSHNNAICYSLLIVSFVLAWLETWFLDFKVLPREQKVRDREAHFRPYSERESLLGNAEQQYGFTGTTDLFQSLPESEKGSDDEETGGGDAGEFRSITSTRTHSRTASMALSLGSEEQEYLLKADEAFDKAYEILHSNEGWKLDQGDDLEDGLIYFKSFANVGRLYKLEAFVEASPQACFDELVNKQAESPTWNPTVLEAKIIQVIEENVDVCYNVAAEAVGGLVSSRDFVTLRKFGERNGCLLTTGMAVSHPDCPPVKKHVRGENRPGGWMFKPVPGKPHRTLLVWVINTDLKGWIPQYAVDQALSGVLLSFLRNFRLRMDTLTGRARRR